VDGATRSEPADTVNGATRSEPADTVNGAMRSEPGGAVASDRGSASLWVLGVGLAVLLFAGAVAAAGSVLVAKHRAQAAADLGALAGAVRAVEGPDVTCARVREIVESNRASLVECRVDGFDVIVGAEVEPAGVGRAIGPALARARAGPARM
jgi:secretion/DNA translocation related TadE-like protein